MHGHDLSEQDTEARASQEDSRPPHRPDQKTLHCHLLSAVQSPPCAKEEARASQEDAMLLQSAPQPPPPKLSARPIPQSMHGHDLSEQDTEARASQEDSRPPHRPDQK
eukprot:SAG31_NODE_35310_length_324_cov_0.960000_1_plen_107_part_11